MILATFMIGKPYLYRFDTGQVMSPISGIRGSIVTGVGRAPRDATLSSRDEARTESSRALIPLEPIASSDTPLRTRPQATYLAHLIATKDKLPQTRDRRRAEPQDAIAAYAAAGAEPAAPAGITLARVM
jgi:hypothetical protein